MQILNQGELKLNCVIGFVSNSSSSSFVCDLCNRAEEIYDDSVGDNIDCRCENGHNLCRSHMLDLQINDAVRYMMQYAYIGDAHTAALKHVAKDAPDSGSIKTIVDHINSVLTELPKRHITCAIEILQLLKRFEEIKSPVISLQKFMSIAYEHYDGGIDVDALAYHVPSSACPICRMEKFARDDIIRFAISEFECADINELYTKIRNTYGSYERMQHVLEGIKI